MSHNVLVVDDEPKLWRPAQLGADPERCSRVHRWQRPASPWPFLEQEDIDLVIATGACPAWTARSYGRGQSATRNCGDRDDRL